MGVILILVLGLLAFLALCFSGLLPKKVLSVYATALQFIKGTGVFTPRHKRVFDYDEVVENVFVGRQPRHKKDIHTLIEEQQVKAVIVLNEEKELFVKNYITVLNDLGIEKLHIPTPDYQGPSVEQLHEAVDFIRYFAERDEPVYIHCHGGKGRSAAVAAAYVLSCSEDTSNVKSAVKAVKKSKYSRHCCLRCGKLTILPLLQSAL